MQELMQPLIHKAAVHNLAVKVGRTGLAIGDEARLIALPDGRIGVFALLHKRFLGLFSRRTMVMVGCLGPQATTLLAPAVTQDELLRVRIVGLTPEHLATETRGPEIHISVWGDPRHIRAAAATRPQAAPPEPPAADPEPQP